jgi:adenosylcobinamide-GDP ribazoletransferase
VLRRERPDTPARAAGRARSWHQSSGVRAAAAAVTFLTRLPVATRLDLDGNDVARGALFFPLVGAGIGAATGGVAVLLHPQLSGLAAAGIAVAVAVVLTGALHVDALADTADAAGSPRERALEIMRDSRVGSFGAAAVALDLLVKAAAIAQLLDEGGAVAALVAAGALSRAVSPPLAALLPYPRIGGGSGSVLTGRVGAGAVAAPLLGAAVVTALGAYALVGAVAAVAVVLGLVYRRWLGGVTGDALGAVTEVSETVALVVAAAIA